MHLHIGCTLALLVGSSRALVTPGSSGRLLVCGGSGFLGREVCREAVARGWAVTSLSRRGVNPEPGSTLDAVKVTLTVDALKVASNPTLTLTLALASGSRVTWPTRAC